VHWIQRRFWRRLPGTEAGTELPVQSFTHSDAALEATVVAERRACAVICPRAVPATEFAALSHALMNGFFFNHGLDMEAPDVAVHHRQAVPRAQTQDTDSLLGGMTRRSLICSTAR